MFILSHDIQQQKNRGLGYGSFTVRSYMAYRLGSNHFNLGYDENDYRPILHDISSFSHLVSYLTTNYYTNWAVASRRLNWRSGQAVSLRAPSLPFFLPSPSLLPLPFLTFPSLYPLFPLEVGPYIAARGSGEHFIGVRGLRPGRKSNFGIFGVQEKHLVARIYVVLVILLLNVVLLRRPGGLKVGKTGTNVCNRYSNFKLLICFRVFYGPRCLK